MRHLILTRGAPGAGKTRFLADQGLTPYAVTPDDVRLSFGGVTLTEAGDLAISHGFEKAVWARVEETLEFKMSQGQLVVLDATHQRTRDFSLALKLAERHRYSLHCLDFTTLPKETAHARNRQRPAWKIVPEQVIETAYDRFERHALPKKIERWDAVDFEGLVFDRLEPSTHDLSEYAAVVHIGDLQGCFAPLEALLKDGMRDDVFYIFVGDLLDRGIQNGEVIRFATENIVGKPNVQLIWGNHEYHIHRFSKGMDPVSREFLHNTLPQIQAAGFTPRDANHLLDETVDAFKYAYRGRKGLVTHAGAPRVPERLAPLPSLAFWKGVAGYGEPVDAAFAAAMTGTEWLQVHGHRNPNKLPLEAAPGSFNLEAEVEFGGHLRVMTLVGEGASARIETQEIPSTVHRKKRDRRPDALAPRDVSEVGKLSQAVLDKLEAHPLVRSKSFATRPWLRSLNFTNKAFYDQKWDQVNIMARGLFVADDRRIVARSYPKFFNLEERAETRMRALRHKLAFPLKLWVKENGYLGILGWDHLAEPPGLFFASKSTPEGVFAQWFEEIFRAEAGEEGLFQAERFTRDRNLTLVFEVNDPDRDPHMIAYDHPHVVLLDAIERIEAFRPLPAADRDQIAAALGVQAKAPGPTFKEWREFEGWLKSVEAQGRYFQWKGKDVEGFVAEDASGFLFKIKLDFYSFWKAMRSHRDRLRKARETGQPEPLPRVEDPEAHRFHDWLSRQPTERLSDSIIALREAYEGGD